MSIGVLWYGDDIRITDHSLLYQASLEVDHLICLYCTAPDSHLGLVETHYHPAQRDNAGIKPSANRIQFRQAGLFDLDRSLKRLGNRLWISTKSASATIDFLVSQFPITHIYRHQHPGFNEANVLHKLQTQYSDIRWITEYGLTLFRRHDLPFALPDLPDSFSKFRKLVESLDVPKATTAPKRLPSTVNISSPYIQPLTTTDQSADLGITSHRFIGGESYGHTHMADYFASGAASSYKDTRNALDDWSASTKFSPWLAQGSISARQLKDSLTFYESRRGANDSTYWIYFELLWRDYFHWYALKHGARLFYKNGVGSKSITSSYYAERFKKWCHGNTPFPIVNASMKQLNQTGFISNRARQLVASCLIYDLGIDWRYGAAYFEAQLIDYDVAANWGNWQYIAGVGADPRGGRHFNLQKQTDMYDPDRLYIKRWQGDTGVSGLDSVDAADWPIYPTDPSASS